jgi:hypothetical protein
MFEALEQSSSRHHLTMPVGVFLLCAAAPLPKCGAQSTKGKRAAVTVAPVVNRLDITLAASRPQLSPGSTLAITGTLTNTSTDSTLYLTQASVTLMEPPELEGPIGYLRGWYAYFPSGVSTDTGKARYDDAKIVVALRPGASTVVGWSPNLRLTAGDSEPGVSREWFEQVKTQLRYLFFVPGDYLISVQAKYWTDPKRPEQDYRITTQNMTVHMLAPQFVILLGAALGGLIAYFIFPSSRIRQAVQGEIQTPSGAVSEVSRVVGSVSKGLGGALGAMLWSAIVTILLSRLSGTQFLIQVTASDFWGAIAIGLVAQYAGLKGLEKLFPAADTDSGQSTAQNKPEDATKIV